jgi:MOSC domain-containing protein YiiM
MQSIDELRYQFTHAGKLTWIGLRPGREQALQSVDEVLADQQKGLLGDRYQGRSGKRQVTLIQQEHLFVIESILGKPVTPEILRRNLVVAGINLLALNKQTFRIGDALLLATGFCHPCSRMEKVLGAGGYNAMRGHGGLTAQVIESGIFRVGDNVTFVAETVDAE